MNVHARVKLAVSVVVLAIAGCTSGGAGTWDGGFSVQVAAQAAAPEGLYGIANGQLVYVDPDTAVATRIGPVGLGIGASGSDFACDGTFWGLSASGNGLVMYTVDLSTGAGTEVKRFDTQVSSVGFEFGHDEVTPYWRSAAIFSTLDVSTGTVTQVSTLTGNGQSLTMPQTCDGFLTASCGEICTIDKIDPATNLNVPVLDDVKLSFTSLAAAPDGRLFGGSGDGLYRIDLVNGSITLIGKVSDGETSYPLLGLAYGPKGVCCAAPDCSTARAVASPAWPPNHKFATIGVEGVTSPSGAAVTVTITGVRQDEPVNGLGDGNTAPDAIIDGSTARVRVERSGTGNGRVYQLGFSATAGGASCTGTVSWCVPHDQGHGGACVDDGPLYDSTAP